MLAPTAQSFILQNNRKTADTRTVRTTRLLSDTGGRGIVTHCFIQRISIVGYSRSKVMCDTHKVSTAQLRDL